jgi:hypothetical protein
MTNMTTQESAKTARDSKPAASLTGDFVRRTREFQNNDPALCEIVEAGATLLVAESPSPEPQPEHKSASETAPALQSQIEIDNLDVDIDTSQIAVEPSVDTNPVESPVEVGSADEPDVEILTADDEIVFGPSKGGTDLQPIPATDLEPVAIKAFFAKAGRIQDVAVFTGSFCVVTALYSLAISLN